MRWSSFVAIGPPPGKGAPPRPSMMMPSSSSSTVTPIARSPLAIVVIRSDSLTRNSSRPRKMLRPCARAAAMKATGYSSIMLGARSGSGSTPVSAEALTIRSPTGSPPTSRAFTISIAPPISRSRSINPARVALRPTLPIVTRDPGTSSAATIGKAAEEGSPGTMICCGLSSASPTREMIRVPSASVSTLISAPKPRSIRSL